MQFLSDAQLPETTFRPDLRSEDEKLAASQEAYTRLVDATWQAQVYANNFDNDKASLDKATQDRIDAMRALNIPAPDNPYRLPLLDQARPEFAQVLTDFTAQLKAIEDQYPQHADVIRAGVPLENDALAITGAAVSGLNEAEALARKELTVNRRIGASLSGSFQGMMRDEFQVAMALVGGGAGFGRTLAARIASVVFAEAAINGGVELAVQAKAEQWREKAGVPLGWDGMWQQVGLAAAFGGGLGGLVQGGGEVMRALGRSTPEAEAALGRVASGGATPEDVALLAETTGVSLPDTELSALARAIDEDAADAATLAGEPPGEMAAAVLAIERGTPMPARVQDAAPIDAPASFAFIPADALEVDARRFQFKVGGDADGVTERLKGITQWAPERAGVLTVFEDASGRRFVADGHQRTGLARRLQAETGEPISLPSYVFRAADGYSAEDVRVIAALKNIGEGSGTALDAAKVLRSGKLDVAATGLPPTSAMVRDAAGLARLSDDGFAMAVNEVVDARYAAIVGRLVDDPRLHAQMLDVLKKADPRSMPEAQSMVKDMLSEPTLVQRQDSLFGEEEVARMLLAEKAAVRQATLRALKKDRAVFNSLVAEQSRIAEAGNVLDIAANSERASTDAIIIEAIDRLSRQVGPISAALNDAARAVAGGQRAAHAARGFAETVRAEIGKAGGNLGRLGDAGPPPLIDPAVAGTRAIEPASAEGAAAAELALREAGGDVPQSAAELEAAGQASMFGASEAGADGLQQILIPGVAEVTVRDLVQAGAARPLTGGTAAPPAGGLFDDAARGQIDLMDALPAGTDAEGRPILTTHAELRAQADRVDHLADIVSSCKD